MSNDDWLSQLKNKEKQIQDTLETDRKKSDQLREKYKEDKDRTNALLDSELKKVVAIFDNPSLSDYDRPKAENGTLRVPIKSGGTSIGLTMNFFLQLNENGYGLKVTKEIYDHTKGRSFTTSTFIPAPVDEKKIQTEIADFLGERNRTIEHLADEEKAYRRIHGY